MPEVLRDVVPVIAELDAGELLPSYQAVLPAPEARFGTVLEEARRDLGPFEFHAP